MTATMRQGRIISRFPLISTAITAADMVCVTPEAKATAPTKAYLR